jgi:hypothetical protein
VRPVLSTPNRTTSLSSTWCKPFYRATGSKQKNILYRENKKENRRKVFYPYDVNPGEISIGIIIEKDIDIETGNDYKVEINGAADTREEINTWDEIFEIKERYL